MFLFRRFCANFKSGLARVLALDACLGAMFLVLAACSGQEPPIPGESTPTPSPIPGTLPATAALEIPTQFPSAAPETLQPTQIATTELPAIPLEPQATAAAIRLAGWSPQGDWLAYWASSPEQVAEAFYPFPAGHLVFFNPKTLQGCDYPEYVAENEADGLDWQAGGEVQVRTGGQVTQGTPCQENFSPRGAPSTQEAVPTPALSPGGEYQAETTVVDSSAGILSLRTVLLALPDNQAINTIEWKIDERLGAVGLGGEWLAGNQFLIYETLDQGPLLATVAGEVTPVATGLFGLDHLPSLLGPEGYNLRADGAAVAGGDLFHIALYGVGSEASFPPVRLFHSEDGTVEEMPFKHLWPPAFSPDGRWLLLDERSIQNGTERRTLWTRPSDPPGSQVNFFAAGEIVDWTVNWDRAAFGQPERVTAYTFPAGEPLGAWTTGAYPALELSWSPDGSKLAVLGGVPGQWRQALFFGEVP